MRCERWGQHVFCGGCGRRYLGADLRWRECPTCHASVASDFCPLDGTHIAIDFVKKMERGEVDWLAEAQMAKDVARRMMAARPKLFGIEDGATESAVEALRGVFRG